MLHAGGRRDSSANRFAEQRDRFVQGDEPMLVDLVVTQSDCAEIVVAERAAIEQEPEPAGSVRFRAQEIDTHQPAALNVKAALLQRLSPAGLPRGLSVGFHLTPGTVQPFL